MQTRFKKKAKVFDIGITAVAGMLSGAAPPGAHLLLCPQGVEDLLQAQPVGHLRHRHDHCRTLQPGPLSGAHR